MRLQHPKLRFVIQSILWVHLGLSTFYLRQKPLIQIQFIFSCAIDAYARHEKLFPLRTQGYGCLHVGKVSISPVNIASIEEVVNLHISIDGGFMYYFF